MEIWYYFNNNNACANIFHSVKSFWWQRLFCWHLISKLLCQGIFGTVAHKGHGKLFLSPQTHSVSPQAHFVLWQTQSFSRQSIFVSFTGHFLTSMCSSQHTFLLHGTLHFFAAHFLPSRHTFSLHGTRLVPPTTGLTEITRRTCMCN